MRDWFFSGAFAEQGDVYLSCRGNSRATVADQKQNPGLSASRSLQQRADLRIGITAKAVPLRLLAVTLVGR